MVLEETQVNGVAPSSIGFLTAPTPTESEKNEREEPLHALAGALENPELFMKRCFSVTIAKGLGSNGPFRDW